MIDTPKNTTTSNNTLALWLGLLHTSGVGPSTINRLLKVFGDISSINSASSNELAQAGLKSTIISTLKSPNQSAIDADISWAQASNHHIILREDSAYPAQLKQLNDAPPLLFVWGDVDYLARAQLAMVGSRNPSALGRKTATEFATHLSNAGITITSGLASGIDGASHEGGLAGLAGTIAVVAHGLDIVYPAKHQQLATQISEHGAVVSEMPIGTKPQRGMFPRRNRLISALSLGTLVVEAAQKSGSLITARFAMEQNREVFAIPGSIHNPMARGCHQLIRQGAKLVESVGDIIEDLAIELVQNDGSNQKRDKNISKYPKDTPKELDLDYKKLLKCLAYESMSIDELVTASQFSAPEVASMLLILELEEFVVCQNGQYSRVKFKDE